MAGPAGGDALRSRRGKTELRRRSSRPPARRRSTSSRKSGITGLGLKEAKELVEAGGKVSRKASTRPKPKRSKASSKRLAPKSSSSDRDSGTLGWAAEPLPWRSDQAGSGTILGPRRHLSLERPLSARVFRDGLVGRRSWDGARIDRSACHRRISAGPAAGPSASAKGESTHGRRPSSARNVSANIRQNPRSSADAEPHRGSENRSMICSCAPAMPSRSTAKASWACSSRSFRSRTSTRPPRPNS